MPGFGGLAGLSATYGGMLDTQAKEQQNELGQLQIGGMEVAGKTIQAMMGPQQQYPGQTPLQPQMPQGAPQPPPMPQYNRPGAPMGIPTAPPQGAPRPPVPMQPPPGRPGAGGQGPVAQAIQQGRPLPPAVQQGLQGRLDLDTVLQNMVRANPGVKPAMLVAGLNNMMPYLKAEEQLKVAQLRLDMQEKMMGLRAENLKLSEERIEETHRHHEETEGAAQERIDTGRQRLTLDRFKFAWQQDKHAQDLAQRQKEAMEKNDLATAKAIAAEKRSYMDTILKKSNIMVDMSPQEKDAFQKTLDENHKQELDRLDALGQHDQPAAAKPAATPAPAAGKGKKMSATERADAQKWVNEGDRDKKIKILQDKGWDTTGM